MRRPGRRFRLVTALRSGVAPPQRWGMGATPVGGLCGRSHGLAALGSAARILVFS